MTIPSNMFQVSTLSGTEAFWLPNPDYPSSGENEIATMVNAARNTAAIVIAQKIGRDQDKVNLAWTYLEKDVWEKMLDFWDRNFFFNLTYYSGVKKSFITRKCYIGDRKFKAFAIDMTPGSPNYGQPISYRDCSANIVDTGEGD